MDRPETLKRIRRLIKAIAGLRAQCLALEASHAEDLRAVDPAYRDSARNLLHYLSLRQRDLRELQDELASLGLSSLGRLEAHALATLNAVLKTLHRLAGKPAPDLDPGEVPADFRTGPALLRDHADLLLGPEPKDLSTRIMVTMPSEAAESPALVRDLVAAGMSIMRINCAHDGPGAWANMVDNLRRAEQELGRKCRVLADLSGPKLRTGDLAAADRIVRLRPRQRDTRRQATEPGRIWLTPAAAAEPAPEDTDGTLLIHGEILERSLPGDILDIADSRGRERFVRIAEASGRSRLAEAHRTLLVAEGARVRLQRGDSVIEESHVGPVPPVIPPLLLRRGDTLLLTRGTEPGRQARLGAEGETEEPARIPCSLDAVFSCAMPGESVWFDDGRIGGVIRAVAADQITVEITFAGPKGSRLRAEKGINLPDTDLDVPALSEKDLADLTFMAGLADLVGLSFVRRPEDVVKLQNRLAELDAAHVGVVLKIENRSAFQRLPDLLLAALRSPPAGIMVARGDLAVEVGFGRLAEIQEEILWLCEAAHVPVIWATQVLEDMAKNGMPSRAEVTDAAMSGRAECVMLNKGPYIVEAVAFLAGVLGRMGGHQTKKTARLRRLSVSALDDNSSA